MYIFNEINTNNKQASTRKITTNMTRTNENNRRKKNRNTTIEKYDRIQMCMSFVVVVVVVVVVCASN